MLRTIEDLRKKNEANPFIERFVAKAGYPLWQYARIEKAKSRNNDLARDMELAEILEVPVVPSLAEYVNGILQIKLDIEILYKLLEKSAYESYGFDNDPARATPNANDFVSKIMSYEKEIWQQDIYQIKDNRLFDHWPAGTAKPASFYLRSTITPDGITIINAYEECWIPNPLNPEGLTPGENGNWGHTGMCLIWTVIIDDDPIPGWGAGNWEGWSGVGPGNGTTTGIAGWSNSDGSSAAGGSSGASEAPCNPDFKWLRLEVINSQLFNPCLNQWMQPPLGSDFGAPPVQVNDVDRSHLTDPCHIAAFDKIGSEKIKAELIKMYTQTYVGTNKVHNLTLWSSSYVPSSDGQGVVLAGSDIDPAQPNTWNIYLSVNTLGNTLSQEAWVGMILHELVHSFIQKNDIGFNPFDRNNTHHTTMLNNWIIQIKDALKEICGMPDADALALALRGFDNIFKDEATGEFLPEMITKVQEMFGVNLNDAKTLADKYYNGQKGTVCQ